MATEIKVGLAGFGNVGKGTYDILERNHSLIRQRAGAPISVKRVTVRNVDRVKLLVDEDVIVTNDWHDLVNDPEVNVVVEAMGGIEPAKSLILAAIDAGKHVVTANKALLAEHGNEIFSAAQTKGVNVAFEAAVAGSIPIVKALREGLAANRVSSIAGIINGTCNFILSTMRDTGRSFDDVLKEAQRLGYAEADPTFDIEGTDSAHKLMLLSAIAFGVPVDMSKVHIEGITHLEAKDIKFAEELGYRIKLLGRARMRDGKLEAGVFPTLVNHTYLLARVGGAYNAVRVEGNAVGSLFLHGLGAGSLPTASAVLGDLISIARQNNKLNSGFVKQVLPQADILPPEEACNTYYMRFMVKDDPGVLRDLSGALSDQGVSIAQAIQKGQSEAGVPLVFMTHEASVSAIRKAVETMRKSDFLLAPAICYRVMG